MDALTFRSLTYPGLVRDCTVTLPRIFGNLGAVPSSWIRLPNNAATTTSIHDIRTNPKSSLMGLPLPSSLEAMSSATIICSANAMIESNCVAFYFSRCGLNLQFNGMMHSCFVPCIMQECSMHCGCISLSTPFDRPSKNYLPG